MSIPFGFALLQLMIVSKILEYKSEHHCDLSVRVFTHFAAAATLILLFPTSTIRAHSLRTFQLFKRRTLQWSHLLRPALPSRPFQILLLQEFYPKSADDVEFHAMRTRLL